MDKCVLAGVLLIIIGVVGVTYALPKLLVIPNEVDVHTHGLMAYWDSERTEVVENITWGWLYPGNSSTKTMWLYNPGNTEVSIDKGTDTWNPPEAESLVTIAWSPDIISLEPHLATETNVTLTIATEWNMTITHFTFDLVLNATET